MTLTQIISSNLRQCLEDSNTTITELASILEVTRPTAYNYLIGQSKIDAVQLFKVAQYFNKHIEWFYQEIHSTPLYTDKDIEKIIAELALLKNTLHNIKSHSEYIAEKLRDL